MRWHAWLHGAGIAACWATAVVALLSLAFRSLFWASWLPRPGEPYGAGDLLDLLLLCLVLLLASLSVLIGLALLFIRPCRFAPLLAGLALPLAFMLLRGLLPVLPSW